MTIPSATGIITSKSILNQSTSTHSHVSQLGIEGNFLNFIKLIYEKPKASITHTVSIPIKSRSNIRCLLSLLQFDIALHSGFLIFGATILDQLILCVGC